MKSLTKSEEQVMQALWKLDRAFLGEIVDELSTASYKPHRNTVATVIKVLIDKKFIGITVSGRNYEYYPMISKEIYSKATMKTVVQSFFDGKYSNALSFMVKEKDLTIKDLEEVLKQIKKLENFKK